MGGSARPQHDRLYLAVRRRPSNTTNNNNNANAISMIIIISSSSSNLILVILLAPFYLAVSVSQPPFCPVWAAIAQRLTSRLTAILDVCVRYVVDMLSACEICV